MWANERTRGAAARPRHARAFERLSRDVVTAFFHGGRPASNCARDSDSIRRSCRACGMAGGARLSASRHAQRVA
ncbi:hypothetical protein C6P75_10850 [Burkholderia multivorans]|nr:hypothetical protein C6P75_10850 [Burkholderia multivorans]